MSLFTRLDTSLLDDLLGYRPWKGSADLDFVVHQVIDVHAPAHFGVKIVAKDDEVAALEALDRVILRGEVPRTLLLVLHDPEMIEEDALIVSILVTFFYDRRNSDHCVLTISPDASFRCFPVKRPVATPLAKDLTASDEIPGHLKVFFRDRGFGFIESAGMEKFFFHVSFVSSELLPALVVGPETEPCPLSPIPVLFRNGGRDDSGRPYARAIDIRAM